MTGSQVAKNITATEAQALVNQGNMVINHKKILLQETLGEVFDYCLMLMKEYYTDEKAYRLSDGTFQYWRASDLKSIPTTNMETKDAEFDIIVSIGDSAPNENAQGSLTQGGVDQVGGGMPSSAIANLAAQGGTV